ncbi:MAG: DUF721 domain-containing protein [Pseudomonadota bacterium]
MASQVASQRPRRSKGFRQAAGLVSRDIREASESRGFAVSRVLTHWDEVAGAEIAAIARPVDISYGRGGLGATLTILTTGAQAPMLDMQKETLRERVNRCYGYTAISRIRITQTAPQGFADGRVSFAHAPKAPTAAAPDPAVTQKAETSAAPIDDTELRRALTRLGENVLKRTST